MTSLNGSAITIVGIQATIILNQSTHFSLSQNFSTKVRIPLDTAPCLLSTACCFFEIGLI